MGYPFQLRARSAQLCLVLVAAALSGCGKDEVVSKSRSYDLEGYIQQSCELKPTEGEPIEAVVTAEPIAASYFGKEYNRDWLLSLGAASIEDSIEYIASKGVRLYRADAMSTKSCHNFSSLEAMPADLSGAFRGVQDRIDAENDARGTAGFLTGLYFLRNPAHSLSTVRRTSVIILREDANRWTLVHEFMHHNFKARAASAQGYDDVAVQGEHQGLIEAYGKLVHASSLAQKDRARQLANLFMKVVDSFDRILTQYQLEEMAIEATLQDLVDDGKLGYVPWGSYENGTRYIARSRKNAVDTYRSLDVEYKKLRDETSSVGLWTLHDRLGDYAIRRDKRMKQIDELIAKRAKAKAEARGSEPGAVASSAIRSGDDLSGTAVAPCASAADGAILLRESAERLRSFRR